MSDHTPEQSDSIDSRRQTFLREMWKDNMDFAISEEELRDLLLRDEFGQRVVEAIKKTESEELLEELKFGKEFGFVVIENRSLSGFKDWKYNKSLSIISPLFAGEEDKINLNYQQAVYRAQRAQKFINKGLLVPDESLMLIFHTHPYNLLLQAKQGEKLMAAILGISNERVRSRRRMVHDVFSAGDLRNFRRMAEADDMSLIASLGVKNPGGIESGGKLVLVSFNNFNSFLGFNPEDIVSKSLEYKMQNLDTPPVEVYKAAGLNAAVLQVDLNSPSSPFNPEEVAQASRVLTTRKAA